MLKKLVSFVVLFFGGVYLNSSVDAQNFGVKTNLLYDATATVNAGAEVGLAPKWSFDLSGNLNAWNAPNDMKWKHWLVQPEIRYWFCERFNGHFLGAHLLGGQHNIGNIPNNISWFPFNSDLRKLSDKRYQGWFVGGGIAYGYDIILDRHWNLEFELGIGVIYTRNDVFECKDCGAKVGSDIAHTYYGPTKAAVNLFYTF